MNKTLTITLTYKDGLNMTLGRASALLNAACTLAEDEQASEDLICLVCMASELIDEAIQHKTRLFAQEVNHDHEAF